MKNTKKKRTAKGNGSLSLDPLSFDEAVTDLLKVKPPPKPVKKKTQSSRTESAKKKSKKSEG